MTRRGAGALLAPLLLVAAAVSMPVLLWPGLGVFALVALLIAVDSRRAPGPGRLRISRIHEPILSTGAVNQVRLQVELPGRRAPVRIRDETPRRCDVSARQLVLDAPGEVTYTVTPRARGGADFGRAVVRVPGPWGLGFRQFTAAQPSHARADADLTQVHVYEALARRGQLEELGVRTMRHRGEGSEFERVREAVPDDPLRSINWAATARTGKLMTSELIPERAQPLVICMDHGRLMGVGAGALTKFDHALNAALLLVHVALRTGDRAGLMAFADSVSAKVTPQPGSAQLRVILDTMAPLLPLEIESDYDSALTQLARWQRRRALVVIFTDVLDPDQATALIRQCALLRRRHLPLVVTVRDPAVDDIATQPVHDGLAAYERAVAAGVLDDRSRALQLIGSSGVDVIDTDARTLSPRLVNRYLEMKRRSRL